MSSRLAFADPGQPPSRITAPLSWVDLLGLLRTGQDPKGMVPQEVVKPPLQISMSPDVDVAGHM